MPPVSQPLTAYKDPESELVVQPLDAGSAFALVDSMPCLVHLLPKFRVDALHKFQKGEVDVFLSGCSPNGSGPKTGMLLYAIEKGRRGVVKLVCRLLCLEGASVAAGRALMIPAAIMHKAQRIEAKVNKRDQAQAAFWQGLGFELSDDTAELAIDAALLSRVGQPMAASTGVSSSSAKEAAASQPPAAAPAAATGTKRGREGQNLGGAGATAAAPTLAKAGAARVNGNRPEAPAAPPTQRPPPQPPAPHPPPPASTERPVEDAPARQISPTSKGATEGTAPPSPVVPRPQPRAVPEPCVDAAAVPAHRGEGEKQVSTEGADAGRADCASQGAHDAPEEPAVAEVYIRVTCPGANEPHLIRFADQPPSNLHENEWWPVPEDELEAGHKVQCTACNRAFNVTKEDAVLVGPLCRPLAIVGALQSHDANRGANLAVDLTDS